MIDDMNGSIDTLIEDRDTLIIEVHGELVALRGQSGILTVQKFSQYPALRRVCGGGDLLDAYFMFERESKRYAEGAGRDEAAAAISITAPAESVLDRFEHVVAALPQDGKLRDQRTARRWSDAGLRSVARDLVYLAEVRGRLGSEVLSIETRGNEAEGLLITIDQMTSVGIGTTSPSVRAWTFPDAEDRVATVDLQTRPSVSVTRDGYTMQRHHLAVELPSRISVPDQAKLLSVSIQGRDSPMRTVMISDLTTFSTMTNVCFTTYRTIVVVDLINVPNSPGSPGESIKRGGLGGSFDS